MSSRWQKENGWVPAAGSPNCGERIIEFGHSKNLALKKRGEELSRVRDDAEWLTSRRSPVITLEACALCCDCTSFSSHKYNGTGFSCLPSKNKRTRHVALLVTIFVRPTHAQFIDLFRTRG